MVEKNTSIVTIAIQKGGAGKTTCAVNLAASYAYLGLKVLLVDLDYQGNATELVGVDSKSLPSERTVLYAIQNSKPFDEVVINTNIENVDLLASSAELFDHAKKSLGSADQNFLLHPLFDTPLLNTYDLVLIDTNPYPDALLQSALTISNYYLVPTFPENDVIDGLATLFKNAETIKKYLNNKLTLLGCIIMKFDKDNAGNVQNERVLRKISKENKIPIFENIIPYSKAVTSASNAHKPLINFLKNTPIAKSYIALAGEIKPLLKGGRVGRSQAHIVIDKGRYNQLLAEESAMVE